MRKMFEQARIKPTVFHAVPILVYLAGLSRTVKLLHWAPASSQRLLLRTGSFSGPERKRGKVYRMKGSQGSKQPRRRASHFLSNIRLGCCAYDAHACLLCRQC